MYVSCMHVASSTAYLLLVLLDVQIHLNINEEGILLKIRQISLSWNQLISSQHIVAVCFRPVEGSNKKEFSGDVCVY